MKLMMFSALLTISPAVAQSNSETPLQRQIRAIIEKPISTDYCDKPCRMRQWQADQDANEQRELVEKLNRRLDREEREARDAAQ